VHLDEHLVIGRCRFRDLSDPESSLYRWVDYQCLHRFLLACALEAYHVTDTGRSVVRAPYIDER
jgi:hypothetical protein